MTKLQTLKNELKELASQIITAKQERKTVRFTGTRTIISKCSWQSDAQYACELAKDLKEQFRYKHIAYCIIRGKEYHEIEQFGDLNPKCSGINDLVKKYDFTRKEKLEYAKRNAEYEAAREAKVA